MTNQEKILHSYYTTAVKIFRCEGGVNSGVGTTGLWRRPGPGMMASDVSVIKYIINESDSIFKRHGTTASASRRSATRRVCALTDPIRDQDVRWPDQATGESGLTRFMMNFITLTSLAIIPGPGRRHRPVIPTPEFTPPSHLSKMASKHSKNGCLPSCPILCQTRPLATLSAQTEPSRYPSDPARPSPRQDPP